MSNTQFRGQPTTAQTNVEAAASRTAFEYAVRAGLPHWLNFETPTDDKSKTDDKPDPIAELRAEFDKRIADAEAKANSAQAEARRLRDESKRQDKPKVEDDEKTRQSKADKEISDRLKVLEDERLEAAKERVNAAIETQATKFGIDPDALEDFKAFLERTYPKKFAFDKTTKSVLFQESEYEHKNFGEWFTETAKAGKFNRYKTSKQTPQSGPSKSTGGKSSSGKEQISMSEFIRRQRDPQGKQNLDVEIV